MTLSFGDSILIEQEQKGRDKAFGLLEKHSWTRVDDGSALDDIPYQ